MRHILTNVMNFGFSFMYSITLDRHVSKWNSMWASCKTLRWIDTYQSEIRCENSPSKFQSDANTTASTIFYRISLSNFRDKKCGWTKRYDFTIIRSFNATCVLYLYVFLYFMLLYQFLARLFPNISSNSCYCLKTLAKIIPFLIKEIASNSLGN